MPTHIPPSKTSTGLRVGNPVALASNLVSFLRMTTTNSESGDRLTLGRGAVARETGGKPASRMLHYPPPV
jgi:hypothetical protein